MSPPACFPGRGGILIFRTKRLRVVPHGLHGEPHHCPLPGEASRGHARPAELAQGAECARGRPGVCWKAAGGDTTNHDQGVTGPVVWELARCPTPYWRWEGWVGTAAGRHAFRPWLFRKTYSEKQGELLLTFCLLLPSTPSQRAASPPWNLPQHDSVPGGPQAPRRSRPFGALRRGLPGLAAERHLWGLWVGASASRVQQNALGEQVGANVRCTRVSE